MMDEKNMLALEKLNQIRLTDQERQRILQYFNDMENSEKILAQCPVENVQPMVHVMPLDNILRDDNAFQPFSRESLLEGAPEQQNGYWQVPRLVD